MKMKKTGILPDFKVYQRTKIKVTGRLKSSKIRLEITACPDDWDTFRNYYLPRKKELLNDLWPFMQQGYLKSNPIKNQKRNQGFINLIKTQAALLHGYISCGLKTEAYCELLVESLKKIIPPEQLESFITEKKGKSHYDPIEITRHIVDSAYSDWIKHNKINISGSDNFEVTYIQGGKKTLNTKNISDVFHFAKCIISPDSSRNNPTAIEFLQDISRAALIVMNYIKPFEPSKTLFSQNIIRAAFPSFSTHTKS